MEWAKETANAAYETAKDLPSKTYDSATKPGETASSIYDKTAQYVPIRGSNDEGAGDESNTVVGASIMNTPPFSSFKPDPSTVWKAFLIYMILTMACTLPWWTFVTAADYFQQLYPGTHIIRFFTLAYFVPWVLVYFLFSCFGREGTSWVKINIALVIEIVALVLIPFLDGVFLSGEHGTTATFWVTLAAVAIAGAADAVGQGALLGISAELPETYTEAYASGAVASGVLAFVVRVITKASLSSSSSGLRISAIIYFSIAPFLQVLAMTLFAYVHYMPEMGYYNSLNLGSFETVRLLLQNESTVSVEVAAGAAIAAVAAGREAPTQPLNWKPVMSRVKLLIIAVLVTSTVSLAVFPGYLTEDVQSLHFGSWTPVLLVGTYVVFDLVGRICIGFSSPGRHSAIFGLSWARALLLFFFVLALVGPSSTRIQMLFFLTAILGFSNGYVIASLTIVFPRSNPANEAEAAGIIHALLMNVGVILGSGLSWLWVLASSQVSN